MAGRDYNHHGLAHQVTQINHLNLGDNGQQWFYANLHICTYISPAVITQNESPLHIYMSPGLSWAP